MKRILICICFLTLPFAKEEKAKISLEIQKGIENKQLIKKFESRSYTKDCTDGSDEADYNLENNPEFGTSDFTATTVVISATLWVTAVFSGHLLL